MNKYFKLTGNKDISVIEQFLGDNTFPVDECGNILIICT